MNHAFALLIDGELVTCADDADSETIARAFRRLSGYAEIVERFGVSAARRMIRKDGELQKILFTEAKCGSALGSTVID